MSWARLDDAILDNEKIVRAGPVGLALHVAAITWSCRNLTDGWVPAGKVRQLLDWGDVTWDGAPVDAFQLALRLVKLRLWETQPGGFQIHDFLVYNPSKEKVLADRNAAKARMQGIRSGDVRANIGRSSGAPVPVPVPQKTTSLRSVRRMRRRPAEELLTTERLETAMKHGMSEPQARGQWDQMGDHEFNSPRSDWTATWRNWCRNWTPPAVQTRAPFAPRADLSRDRPRPEVPGPAETRERLKRQRETAGPIAGDRPSLSALLAGIGRPMP